MDYTGEIFNQTPLLINVDEWLSGKHQILYITGLSGGGKGYYAKQYAEKKKDTMIVELDKFENYQWCLDAKEDNPAVARGDKVIFDFLRKHYHITKDLDIFDNSVEQYERILRKFYIYLIDYVHTQYPGSVIIEGIQLFSDKVFRGISSDDSIIIIRTAAVKDMTKVMDRPHPVFRNRFHTFNDAQQKLKEFEERLNIPAMEALESVVNDPIARVKTPEDLSNWMRLNIKYEDFKRLKPITEILSSKKGSCHEQSVLASFILAHLGYSNTLYFLIEANQNQGGVTHSFVVYKNAGKYCWFENAWEDYAGIHEFNTEKELFQHIRNLHRDGKFGNYAKYPQLQFSYFNYRAGDSLQQMVNRVFRNK